MYFKINQNFFIFSTENIKVRYVNELILQSYKSMPEVIYGQEGFYFSEVRGDTIKIRLDEWLPFHQNVLHLFNGDKEINKIFFTQLRKNMQSYKKTVSRLDNISSKDKSTMAKSLLRCLEIFKRIHTYAVFNMILPSESIKNNLFNSKSPLKIDTFMVSLIESHRIMYRRAELKLLRQVDSPIFRKKVEHFIKNEYQFSRYIEWNFFDPLMVNPILLERILRKKAKKLSNERIDNELNILDKNQYTKIEYIYLELNKLSSLKEKDSKRIYRILTLLVNISTQEELRHILDTKVMYYMGLFLFEEKIDPVRTSLNEIIEILSAYSK
ncbi:hypothetical protein [Listeria booriae]|uniref:hypothetical protein n=1 Tax=Listeria booriae TaxID=1552123 RepID=UPI0016236CD3|nr:hypothetical protein [Listeria booriae]MBC1512036.1 hypothetical protein [Listeria booriae]MBC6150852.1 hypothetical protein [Listeria booriae]MBC6305082.1 hypothetical protein [Listeria booriae]